jgi:hypothetical protein
MHGLGGGRRLARQRASSDPRVMMDRDNITRTGARTPGVRRQGRLNGGASVCRVPSTLNEDTTFLAAGARRA